MKFPFWPVAYAVKRGMMEWVIFVYPIDTFMISEKNESKSKIFCVDKKKKGFNLKL